MSFSDEEAVDLLTQMVRIPSLCGQETEVANLLQQVLERAGVETCRDNAGNVLGVCGPALGNERKIFLLGHMDTVPGVIPVAVRDGSLYGRGAVDAKGPLATAMVAAIRAAGRTKLRITVIGAVQEEGPSVGARYLARQPGPDYLVICEPGGWDSLVLGYKGSQRFTVELQQPATHGAYPSATAPERLVDFWLRLQAFCGEHSPGDAETTAFNALTPSLIGMSAGGDGLQEEASLSIGMRLPPGIDVEFIRTQVPVLMTDAIFHFQAGEPCVRAGKSNALVAAMVRGIRSEGGAPRFKVK
ncbi:MAG: M20/M25/M40 family metallo-hydrolase, partial [Chloroflexota bacterium]